MFAGNYAPAGWATCDGQLLPIAQNTALFSLLGTMYGGDGQTTFALPDLRGRVPVHSGTGPGLSNYQQGQAGGSEANTITVSQMPAHNHTILAVTADGNQNVATNNLPANTKALDKEYSSANPDTTMNPGMVGNTGGNQPVNNIQPYLAVTYIIALQGIYPPHN
ncbi:phage tail protein [Flavobacterium sp. GT3R68]|nr:phage tail protein [Flavobacterium sp. GSN2]TRW94158.1 phage tail protein [Flavobacterium sp. GT3R68]